MKFKLLKINSLLVASWPQTHSSIPAFVVQCLGYRLTVLFAIIFKRSLSDISIPPSFRLFLRTQTEGLEKVPWVCTKQKVLTWSFIIATYRGVRPIISAAVLVYFTDRVYISLTEEFNIPITNRERSVLGKQPLTFNNNEKSWGAQNNLCW